LLTIGIIFIYGNITAQVKTGTAIISGQIRDLQVDSIEVRYYPTYSFYLIDPTQIYTVKVDNGRFKVSINTTSEIGYVKLVFLKNGNEFVTEDVLEPFIIESTDNVFMQVNKGSIKVSGAGSAKYNFTAGIPRIKLNVYDNFSQLPSTKIKSSIEQRWLTRKEVAKLSVANLEKYRNQINPKLINLIRFNIECDQLYWFMKGVNEINSNDDSGENFLISHARYFNVVPPKNVKPEQSTYYADYLFCKERVFASLERSIGKNRTLYFPRIFSNIVTRYDGPVRDKLLLMSLHNLVDRDTADYYGKVLKVIETPEYKELIAKSRIKFGPGAKFFNFELKNTQDSIVRLSDFKGKIVVLDFYFTGCLGCAVQAKAMKPIIERFKTNPDVVFININVDRTRDMFLKAVESEKYSEKESINLYTNGEGEQHQLIKFYGFQGFPQLFLIDKQGRILQEKLPSVGPNGKTGEPDPNNSGVIELIKMINEGLLKRS
jgi:peroxiredoxin